MRESIELDLSAPASFFQDVESRLLASADRFTSKLQTAGRAASTSGAGASVGSQGPGGGEKASILGQLGGGKSMGGVGGFALDVAKAGLDAGGAAIRNLPMGQLDSAAGVNKASRAALGGMLDATVGKIPIAGDWLMGQYNKMNSAIDDPERAAIGQLGGYYANLDAAGVHVDEATKKASFQRSIQIQRIRWQSMRESERLAGEVNMSSRPLLFGLSQFGK